MIRNPIPIPNSSSKCLVENWVEERATQSLDGTSGELPAGVSSRLQLIKGGHKGIFTCDETKMNKDTTHNTSYTTPTQSGIRSAGKRSELRKKFYEDKIIQELKEQDKRDKKVEMIYESEMTKNFCRKDFVPTDNPPSMPHEFEKEQPVTFWSDHRKNIHSVSQEKTGDSPFRKNTSFSKPISEYWDQAQPYNIENWPKM